MLDMRTATVREVQHRLKDILARVQQGESLDITLHGKVVARVVPPPVPDNPVVPDFMARLRRDFPAGAKGKAVSEIIDEERGAR